MNLIQRRYTYELMRLRIRQRFLITKPLPRLQQKLVEESQMKYEFFIPVNGRLQPKQRPSKFKHINTRRHQEQNTLEDDEGEHKESPELP